MTTRKTYTVLKQLTCTYAVVVEANDPTQAILKAYNNKHSDGDLVDDGTVNETKWEVFEGDYPLPLPTSDHSLPRDEAKIHAYIYGLPSPSPTPPTHICIAGCGICSKQG